MQQLAWCQFLSQWQPKMLEGASCINIQQQRKQCYRPHSIKYFNTTSVTTMIYSIETVTETYVQCVRHFIHDTLQTTFPLSDAVINEAPWSVAVRHSNTITCFNWSTVLNIAPKWRDPPDLNPSCWGWLAQCRRLSHAADTRKSFAQCTMAQ